LIVYLNAKSLLYFIEFLVKVFWLVERGVQLYLLVFMFSEEKSKIFLPCRYLFDKVVLKPFYTLALFPETVLEISISSLIDSKAVLLAAHPLT
jgi:hypothetical protein